LALSTRYCIINLVRPTNQLTEQLCYEIFLQKFIATRLVTKLQFSAPLRFVLPFTNPVNGTQFPTNSALEAYAMCKDTNITYHCSVSAMTCQNS
jgi:hypothetical protein